MWVWLINYKLLLWVDLNFSQIRRIHLFLCLMATRKKSSCMSWCLIFLFQIIVCLVLCLVARRLIIWPITYHSVWVNSMLINFLVIKLLLQYKVNVKLICRLIEYKNNVFYLVLWTWNMLDRWSKTFVFIKMSLVIQCIFVRYSYAKFIFTCRTNRK